MGIDKLLWSHDATFLAQQVNKGALEPVELVDAAIARAELVNPELNAVAEKLYDRARERAKTVDRKLPLAGVPFAIKDLAIAQRGVATHSGSCVEPFVPDFDSVLTQRYLAAGLVPIATSTSPEHGLRLVTESKAFGPTRSPWDTSHTTGGSSGGSASLVAAGVVPAAHASDGGGSIRVPAAATGLVGMKVSRGRVPLTPIASESWYGFVVDHAVTRSVRDSALLLDLTHGPDPLSPYQAFEPQKGSFLQAAKRKPGKLAIAVYRASPLGLPVSDETMVALDTAIMLAREGGHRVEEIDLPMVNRDFIADFARSVASSVAGQMRLEATRVGHSVIGEIERATRVLARLGGLLSAGEVYEGVQRLHAASRQLIEATAKYDAVLMPVIAHPPVKVGEMDATGMDEVLENLLDKLHLTRLLKLDAFLGQLMDKSLWFTHWTPIQNVTGQPAVSLPVHVTKTGLPIGIQAVGRPGDEETLYSLAGQIEKLSGWLERRAPLHVPQ